MELFFRWLLCTVFYEVLGLKPPPRSLLAAKTLFRFLATRSRLLPFVFEAQTFATFPWLALL